jgi:2'-hydroxyisoflavone reductase
MKLLVIGGTRFVGRHIVEAALARGDRVTLFNRGRSGPAPGGAEFRQGDRNGDLAALAEGRWDAVIDTCGYLPAEIDRMAQALRGRVGCYLFISSVSVYANTSTPSSEDSPLGEIDDTDTTTVDARTYGPLKALCEAQVERGFPGAALLLRPGLIVGPHDPTQRFTFWPARLARAADGDTVLAPGTPNAPVQWIDARDLAAFALRCIDRGARGAFNVVSQAGRFTFGELLAACAGAAGVKVRFQWCDVAALQAQGVQAWSDLPLAVPDDDEHHAFHLTDASRAIAAGLTIRPLAQTVADTLAWYRGLPPEQQVFDKAGLTPQREAAALALLESGATPPAPSPR